MDSRKTIVFRTREKILGGGERFLLDLLDSAYRRKFEVVLKSPKGSGVARMAPQFVRKSIILTGAIVIANDFRSVWKSILQDGLAKRKFVVHGPWQLSYLRVLICVLFRVEIFVVNRELHERVISLGGKPHLLPIGIVRSNNSTRLKVFQGEKIRFGSIGRLDPIKSFERLSEVTDSLDQPLILVTPRPASEKELQMSRRLGRIPNLQYETNGDAQQVWDECSVFLQTSQYESFGLVLLEALDRGLIVLTVAEGGPRELLDGDLAKGILPSDVPLGKSVPIAVRAILNSNPGYQLAAEKLLEDRGPEKCLDQLICS